MFLFELLFFFLLLAGAHGLDEKCNKNKECQIRDSICKEQKCICDDLYYLKGSQCLPYVTEYKGYCEEKQQCEWLGEKSDCIKHKCVCEKSHRWFQGKCRKYVNKGENCQEAIDCYDGQDLQSLTCGSGKCVCSTGYYDRGGDCRRNSFLLEECAIDQDCNSKHCKRGKCHLINKPPVATIAVAEDGYTTFSTSLSNKVSIDLNDALSCEFDNECREIVNSLCNSKTHTCACPENTYLDNGICVPGFLLCKTDTDCSQIGKAMCFKQKTCICKPSYFQRNGKCIPELGVLDDNYKNAEDCATKSAVLKNKICYCKRYWFTEDGNRNCIKTMLSEFRNCLTNDWCKVMGQYSFCNSSTSKCECSINAKLNQTTYYCEKISEIGDNLCINDNDCTKNNEQCLDQKCQCVEKFNKNKEGVCVPSIQGSCFHTDICPSESGCLDGLCQCRTNYKQYNQLCLKDADNFEDSCVVDEQCKKLPFTKCSLANNATTKTCSCIDDYTAIGSRCWKKKLYGDPCMTKTECTTVLNESFQCRNSRCQCPVGRKQKNGYCSGATSFLSERRFVVVSLFLFLFRLVLV